jgi:hypothetical protein
VDPELEPASCPNERLDEDGVELLVDDVINGMPPIMLLDGADALELELDDRPNVGEETGLDGDNSPDELDPAGGWLAALSLESRPRAPLEPLDPCEWSRDSVSWRRSGRVDEPPASEAEPGFPEPGSGEPGAPAADPAPAAPRPRPGAKATDPEPTLG